jgi:lysylphosphatidylglycerol synthetase-like protein (DUF2156 family)
MAMNVCAVIHPQNDHEHQHGETSMAVAQTVAAHVIVKHHCYNSRRSKNIAMIAVMEVVVVVASVKVVAVVRGVQRRVLASSCARLPVRDCLVVLANLVQYYVIHPP